MLPLCGHELGSLPHPLHASLVPPLPAPHAGVVAVHVADADRAPGPAQEELSFYNMVPQVEVIIKEHLNDLIKTKTGGS